MKHGRLFGIQLAIAFGATWLWWTGMADCQEAGLVVPSSENRISFPNSCQTIGHGVNRIVTDISLTGSWTSLGCPETASVSECSIAGNATDLYVIYDNWHPELNFNLGYVKKWDGIAWNGSGTINDCNGPVIAMKDSVIVEGWLSKNYRYNFSTNENGNWWGVESSSLYHQYDVHVAIAERDKGYISYVSGAGDLGVCVDCPPAGFGCVMAGHGSNTGGVGFDAQFTADDSGWVSLYAQNGWLYAYGTTGPCNSRSFNDIGFRSTNSSGNVQPVQIVSRAGKITAIWTESGDSLYVAQWVESDSKWEIVLSGSTTGTFFGISASTVDSVLYMSFGDTEMNPRLYVLKFDGESLTYFDGQIEDDASSTITSVSLAVYKDSPTLAFIENGTLKIKTYSTGTGIRDRRPVPSSLALYQNYPNPFNPSTIITYEITHSSNVSLIVYDILGRQVEVLVNGERIPGHYSLTFDGGKLPGGVYFYRLQAGNYSATKKLMLLK